MIPLSSQSPKKIRQLTMLVSISVGLIVIGWLVWVSKFGFSSGGAEDTPLFESWRKSSQAASEELKIFKSKLNNTMTDLEKTAQQEKTEQVMIEKLKQEIITQDAFSSSSQETSSTPTSTTDSFIEP
jgi:hypothetical protein